MNCSDTLWLLINGEERGPFTRDQVGSMLEKGSVGADTLFKTREQWKPLVDVMSGEVRSLASGLYALRLRDKEIAPLTAQQVQSMWDTGVITADAVYRVDEVWRPLEIASLGSTTTKATSNIPPEKVVSSPAPTVPNPVTQKLANECNRHWGWLVGESIFYLLMVALNFPLFLLGAIFILRDWCRRRTLKVLQARAWNHERFFVKVWLRGYLSFLWRSFLASAALAFLFGLAAISPEQRQARSAIPLGMWILGVILSLDVPFWIKRRLDAASRWSPEEMQQQFEREHRSERRHAIAQTALAWGALLVAIAFVVWLVIHAPNNRR